MQMESVPSSLRKGGQRGGNSVEPVQLKNIASIDSRHLNLYSFLSVAQQYGLEFMPITWDPARESLGAGISGRVNQSLINAETSLAFKRPSNFNHNESSRQQMFRAWLLEIVILRSPQIQQHPNIIDLEGIAWELGNSWSTMLPVLVYRKSQLGSLRKYFESRASALGFNQRLKMCVDLASALSTLHSCSVIHGDMKPDNIVVFSKSDGSNDATIKIIDFGCSSFGLEDLDLVEVTGTPLWSAPENRGDEVTIVDAKKMDVYSFGLVCLWLLCFDHQLCQINTENKAEVETALPKPATWTRRLIESIRSADALEVSISRLLKQFCPSIPSKHNQLVRFLVRTLSKDPENRPHEWSEYTSLLRQLCDTSPLDAPLDGQILNEIEPKTCNFNLLKSLVDFEISDFRLRRYIVEALEHTMNSNSCSRCSANAAFQLALCRSIGFGGFGGVDSASSLLVSSNRTTKDLDEELAIFCEAQHSDLSQHLQKLVVGYTLDLPYAYQRDDCLGVAEIECEKEMNHRLMLVSSDHPSVVRLKNALGHIYERLDRWEKAEKLYTAVREAQEKASSPDAHSTLITEVKIADCLINQGKTEQGQKMISSALHRLKNLKGDHHKSTIATMGYLASANMKQGKFKEAGALLDQQMVLSKRSGGETHVDTLSILLNMALNQLSAGEWQKAEVTSLRAMEMQEEVLGYSDREVLTGLHLRCRTLIEQGQYGQAKKIYEQEMRVYQKAGKTESLGALLARDNLCLILSGQGKPREAVKIAEPNVDAMEKLMGPKYPETIVMQNNLARVYLQSGSPTKARTVQEEAITSMESIPGLIQMEAPGINAGLADIYFALNQWDLAEINYLKATELAVSYFGAEHPWTLYIRGSLATVYRSQFRLEEAKQVEQEVLKLMKEDPGAHHVQTLKLMRNMTDTYLLLNELQKAEQLQEELESLRPPSSAESDILEDKINRLRLMSALKLYGEVQTEQENVSERLRIIKGEDYPATLESRYDLVNTYIALKDYKKAECILAEDVPRHTHLYSKHHDLTLKTMSVSALLSSRQGHYGIAEQKYKEISEMWIEMGLQSHPSALKARIGVAYAQVNHGNADDANETLKRLRLDAEEGKIEDLSSLRDEIDVVVMLIFLAKLPPGGRELWEQLLSSEANRPASSAPN